MQKYSSHLSSESTRFLYAEHRKFRTRRQLAHSTEILDNLAQQTGIRLIPDTGVSRMMRRISRVLVRLATLVFILLVAALIVWFVVTIMNGRLQPGPFLLGIFVLSGNCMLLYEFRYALFYADTMISYPSNLDGLYRHLARMGTFYRGEVVSINVLDATQRELIYAFTVSGRKFEGRYVTKLAKEFAAGQEINVLFLYHKYVHIIL